jgi:hypothetical protein
MTGDAKQKARADVKRVQSKFERAQGQLHQIGEDRRQSFERARQAGLTLREIAEAAGLHWTRVGNILKK